MFNIPGLADTNVCIMLPALRCLGWFSDVLRLLGLFVLLVKIFLL